MTGTIDLKDLVRQSLFAPTVAARDLLSIRLPREWLWMALALMSVLNSIVYSVGIRLTPPSDPTAVAMMPPLFQSPLLFTLFLFGGLVITVFTLTWIGQSLGGKAQLGEILTVIAWMQVLRLLFQVAVTVLAILSTQLSAMLVILGSLWGIYVLAGFINTAHGYDSWIKSLGVMILAGVAMAIGLTMIMTVIGVLIVGTG